MKYEGVGGRRGGHLVITLRGSTKYHQTPLNRWREERGCGHAYDQKISEDGDGGEDGHQSHNEHIL